MIMNYIDWIDQIKTQLGYPVVNVYMTDEMIKKQIDISLKKVAPYCNSIEILHVSNKVTKFEDKKVLAVLRVNSLDSEYIPTSAEGMSYYDYLITKSVYNQLGGINNNPGNIVNIALYNYYAEETRADLCPIGFRLVDQTLYIDGDNPPYEVEAVTESSLLKMSQDYSNWTEEYSLALCKIVEGEIRSKITVVGSPITLNGSDLKSDGKAEKDALEQKLGNQMALYFCTR